MKIAVAQLDTAAGDLKNTAKRIVTCSEQAAKQGVDLLLFGFCTLTGPHVLLNMRADEFLVEVCTTLYELAPKLKCDCLVPVCLSIHGEPTVDAFFLHDSKAIPLHMAAEYDSDERMRLPFPIVDFPGIANFTYEGLNIGIAFSYEELDLLHSLPLKYDAVIYFSSYSYALDEPSSAMGASLADNRFSGDAQGFDALFIGVGSIGTYAFQVYSGGSFVLDQKGQLLQKAPSFEESLMVCDISGALTAKSRKKHPQKSSVKEQQNDEIDLLSADKQDFLGDKAYNKHAHLWSALRTGLCGFVAKANKRQVVLLVDGSLRSRTLALLASDALGPANVHVLLDGAEVRGMSAQISAAQKLLDYLHVETKNAADFGIGDLPRAKKDLGWRQSLVWSVLQKWASNLDALTLDFMTKTDLAFGTMGAFARSSQLLPFGDVYLSDLVQAYLWRTTDLPLRDIEYLLPEEYPKIYLGSSRKLAISFSNVSKARVLPPGKIRMQEADVIAFEQLMRIDNILAERLEWERSAYQIVHEGFYNEDLIEGVLRSYHAAELVRRNYFNYLLMSSTSIFDARVPLGFAWQDSAKDPSANEKNIAYSLQQMGALDGGEGNEEDFAEFLKSMSENEEEKSQFEAALSLFQDIFSPPQAKGQRPAQFLNTPHAQFRDSSGRIWPTPFSEN